MTALKDRDYPCRIVLAGATAEWEGTAVEASDPVAADAPSRIILRRTDRDGTARYAYFAGRTVWAAGDTPVCEGYLFAVSPGLRRLPARYPSDGRVFRALGEATVTADPRLLESLRKAYDR